MGVRDCERPAIAATVDLHLLRPRDATRAVAQEARPDPIQELSPNLLVREKGQGRLEGGVIGRGERHGLASRLPVGLDGLLEVMVDRESFAFELLKGNARAGERDQPRFCARIIFPAFELLHERNERHVEGEGDLDVRVAALHEHKSSLLSLNVLSASK